MLIDLIDHRQKPVGSFALTPVNLVNANGMDGLQLAMGQTPPHEPFHRMINGLPTGLERSGRFPPRHPTRPNGPKTPSWPWSRVACLGSRECAQPPPRAPGIPLAGACGNSGSRLPTAAQIASAALLIGHSPDKVAGR